MTPMQKCNSCGGIYDPTQPGGYYHACPPVTVDGKKWTENINKRDENVVMPSKPDVAGDTPKTHPIKSEGKGTTAVVV